MVAACGCAILIAATIVLGRLPAQAADDPLLARFVGAWIGRGTYRSGPTGAAEPIYCRIANRLVDGGAALEQTGRCALATNSGRISGRISARGKGHYEGSLQSFSTAGPTYLAGSGADGRIELRADFVDRMSKQPGRAIISLVIAGGRQYRLTSNTLGADDKPAFVASDILFTPE
jgi:hypothetical protein